MGIFLDLASWVRRLGSSKGARRARPTHVIPRLEQLEDRRLLSGVITGTVYQDHNGSGTREPGDGGLQGWTLQLLDSAGNILKQAVSAPNGGYAFAALAAGTYQVRETVPTGWVPTTTNPALATIVAGGPNVVVNFGDVQPGVVTIDPAWLQQRGPGPYVLDQGYTTYVLNTDVRTAGTAFVVAASNVALDLNQHTVTYGDAPAPVVANGGFEQGSGTAVPGWDLTGAPAASVAPSTGLFLYGNQVLRLANFSTAQTIVSDPIAIPSAGRLYTATITPAHSGSWNTQVALSVIDDVTGQVLASGTGSAYRGFSAVATFYAATTDAVRLQVVATPPTGQADSLDLDYAALTASFDYGVLASDLWSGSLPGYRNLPAGAQSGYHFARNFTVRNGVVAQGQGGGYESDPLFFNTLPGLTVDGVQTQATGMDVSSLEGDFASGAMTVRNSTFQEAIDNISNRMRNFATLAFNNTNGTLLIDGNQLLGSPQVGIMLSFNNPQYTLTVSNNTIEQNAVVTNGYGIGIAALRNFTIAGNTITPTSGRGIDVDGWSAAPTADGQIYGNYVSVQEHANREYATVQARALRLRNDVNAMGAQRNLDIYNNTFIATTGPGMATEAYGARISYVNPNGEMNDANIQLHDNTFKAVVTTADPRFHGRALLIDGVAAGINLQISRNVLESNDVSLGISGADLGNVFGVTLLSNTLSKSSSGAARPYTGVLVGYWNYQVQDVLLLDMRTANGATADIVFQGSGAKSVSVGWLLDVTATDAAGQPVSGATVNVFDNLGVNVATGVTGADGRVQGLVLVTTTYSQPGPDPRGIVTTTHGPFTVAAASGALTASAVVDPAADLALLLVLT
jgi:hypothetical protein